MMKLCRDLFSSPDNTYESARWHAEALDQQLGFKVAEIEGALLALARQKMPEGSHRTWGQGLHDGNQTWVGLSHQTLQTPYNELRQICEFLNPSPNSTMVDLGAGYGRLGLVLAALFPEVYFLGLEYVPERVVEGQRILQELGCTRAQLMTQDLAASDFSLPQAEYYFLYDYGNVSQIRHTLSQLEEMSMKKNFKVIARGKGSRSLIQYEHPWLSQVYPAHHHEHFSVYSMSEFL
jgi:hypothetical protein